MGQGEPSDLEILVVDDDPDVLEIASASLAAEGYRIYQARNASDALKILDEHRTIALLFTDIVMPGSLDGFDLAERAKARRPGLRVIYTSGYLKEEGVWDGLLLTKPWSAEDLKSAVADTWPTTYPRGNRPRRH